MSIRTWRPGDPVRPCGDEHGRCNACCKIPAIPELDKPAGEWCRHCDRGRGCAIYDARPDGCRAFQCLWTVMPELAEDLRPDRSKVMWTMPTGDEPIVVAITSYPKALHTRANRQLIDRFQRAGVQVVVRVI